ncbi:hypothetical protein [Staphylococcus felis]|uniref:hypothetical protein n=2 Tax=Staphylococcus felis TaxID=46127 RepID=UPI000CD23006|nr:hypothetical protein [Staphylococcus felis]AVP35889.1 hypothetical protein C7J90_02570 [Staphylococcus felis]PNZ37272.1 hypothetical protein CD143_02215 [Staphylococcus felis]
MKKVSIKNRTKHDKLMDKLAEFEMWINRYRNFRERVTIIIHDKPILSYGDWSDCQVDLEDRVIYYSLFDIESYQVERKVFNRSIDGLSNATYEIVKDLSLQLAKFYIIDRDEIDYRDFVEQYDTYKQDMYKIHTYMSNQFVLSSDTINLYTKKGIEIKYEEGISSTLKEGFLMFENFLLSEFSFPVKVIVSVTFDKLNDGAIGHFFEPTTIYNYPKIFVSINHFDVLLQELGEFDAVLNILRIFAHEIGHYLEYTSGYMGDNESSEIIADNYEDSLIQKFIDEVYYVYYD